MCDANLKPLPNAIIPTCIMIQSTKRISIQKSEFAYLYFELESLTISVQNIFSINICVELTVKQKKHRFKQ